MLLSTGVSEKTPEQHQKLRGGETWPASHTRALTALGPDPEADKGRIQKCDPEENPPKQRVESGGEKHMLFQENWMKKIPHCVIV